MNSNIIFNGEFTQPTTSTDLFIYSTDFIADQQKNYYWSCGVYTAIRNGTTAFAFPDPILI